MSRNLWGPAAAFRLTAHFGGKDKENNKMATDLELFVPGRVCLFGEHTGNVNWEGRQVIDALEVSFADWAGSFRRFNSKLQPGRTIVVGTNAGLFARIRPHPDSLVLYSTDNDGVRKGPFTIAMNAKALLEVAAEGGFWSCKSMRYHLAWHSNAYPCAF